jgi:hypothetical protein
VLTYGRDMFSSSAIPHFTYKDEVIDNSNCIVTLNQDTRPYVPVGNTVICNHASEGYKTALTVTPMTRGFMTSILNSTYPIYYDSNINFASYKHGLYTSLISSDTPTCLFGSLHGIVLLQLSAPDSTTVSACKLFTNLFADPSEVIVKLFAMGGIEWIVTNKYVYKINSLSVNVFGANISLTQYDAYDQCCIPNDASYVDFQWGNTHYITLDSNGTWHEMKVLQTLPSRNDVDAVVFDNVIDASTGTIPTNMSGNTTLRGTCPENTISGNITIDFSNATSESYVYFDEFNLSTTGTWKDCLRFNNTTDEVKDVVIVVSGNDSLKANLGAGLTFQGQKFNVTFILEEGAVIDICYLRAYANTTFEFVTSKPDGEFIYTTHHNAYITEAAFKDWLASGTDRPDWSNIIFYG